MLSFFSFSWTSTQKRYLKVTVVKVFVHSHLMLKELIKAHFGGATFKTRKVMIVSFQISAQVKRIGETEKMYTVGIPTFDQLPRTCGSTGNGKAWPAPRAPRLSSRHRATRRCPALVATSNGVLMAFGFMHAGNTKGGLGDRVTWVKGMKAQIIDIYIYRERYKYIRFWIGKFWKEATPFWAEKKLLFTVQIPGGIGFIHSTNEPSSGMTNDKWRAFWTKSFTWGKCSFRLSGLQEFMLKWGWTMLNQPPKPTQNRPLLYWRSAKLTCCVCVWLTRIWVSFLTCSAMVSCF